MAAEAKTEHLPRNGKRRDQIWVKRASFPLQVARKLVAYLLAVDKGGQPICGNNVEWAPSIKIE
jgi:hypothetical protein